MGARPMLARSQFEYARLVLDSDPERANTLLAAATAIAEELGLTRLHAAVAALRAGAATRPTGEQPTLRQEGEFWTIGWGGRPVVRIRDSKGLHYLYTLVANRGREIRSLDLARGPDGAAASDGRLALPADRGTGADELIDATAREAYRRRLTELRTEREEAERWHDTERAARVAEETDFLERELVTAVGLGGRPRRLGSEAERARVAVTRAIRAAIRRIAAADRELGARLDAAVRTGTYCSFAAARAAEPTPATRSPAGPFRPATRSLSATTAADRRARRIAPRDDP
jgi:hypothetical protein